MRYLWICILIFLWNVGGIVWAGDECEDLPRNSVWDRINYSNCKLRQQQEERARIERLRAETNLLNTQANAVRDQSSSPPDVWELVKTDDLKQLNAHIQSLLASYKELQEKQGRYDEDIKRLQDENESLKVENKFLRELTQDLRSLITKKGEGN